MKSIEYFQSTGFPCPIHSNPSDFYMQIMHREYDSAHCRQRFDNFFEQYDKSLKLVVEEEIS